MVADRHSLYTFIHYIMSYHLRQVCDLYTKQTVWYNGQHYMSAVDYAKHARIDALIEANDKLLSVPVQ